MPAIPQASQFLERPPGLVQAAFHRCHAHKPLHLHMLERCYILRQFIPLVPAEAALGLLMRQVQFQQHHLHLVQLRCFVINGLQEPLAVH